MIDQKRVSTNRANALASTGPKTPEGKAASSMNALRHGLRAQEVLLPDEDRDAFEALRARLAEELAPVGELEAILVDRIAGAAWRLLRVGRVESGLLAWGTFDELRRRAKAEAGRFVESTLDRLVASEHEITNKRQHAAACRRAEAAARKRDSEETAIGQAFARDAGEADALGKVSRYEAHLERTLYRALHELQRLQAARAGQAVPPPAVLDVDLAVSGLPAGAGTPPAEIPETAP